MITPSFSLTATERVLPKLALDFTTANLDSRVTLGYQDHSISGGKDVLSIGYEELIAPLIKAVQQLSAEIAKLKAKNG